MLLALAWLLPNHYPPWSTFHTDAWVAVMMAIVCAAVMLRVPSSVPWRPLTMLCLALATVPFLQFSVGLLAFSGQAWLYTLFLLGVVLALLTGAQWEKAAPGKAADALFLAIGIASLVSVGIQLSQWLGLVAEWDETEMWVAGFMQSRPSANLGQANQLATLYVWGIVACGWGIARRQMRPSVALLLALYLLLGVALTQSRTAIVEVIALTMGVWWWRRFWPAYMPGVMALLVLFVVGCMMALPRLGQFLQLELQMRAAEIGGGAVQLRLKSYALFWDAVLQRPLLGYGWSNLAAAQMAVAENHPSLTSFFTHSHNLFLDLLVWCGIPLGGGVSLALIYWMCRRISLVNNREDLVLAMFLVAVGLHAMVEFPLHYAYFLLPTGLVMGMLEQRQRGRILASGSRWAALGLLAVCSLVLGMIVRDYLRVEQNFRAFRFEAARIGNLPPAATPDLLILNNFAEFMRNARAEFRTDLSDDDMQRLYRVASSFPSPVNLLLYGQALAIRAGAEPTQSWLRKVERVVPAETAEEIKDAWIEAGKQDPRIAAVEWPHAAASTRAAPSDKSN